MPRDGIAGQDADALDPLTALPTWVKGEKRLSSMLPYVSLVADRTIRTRGCAFRDHPITGSDNIRSVIPI